MRRRCRRDEPRAVDAIPDGPVRRPVDGDVDRRAWCVGLVAARALARHARSRGRRETDQLNLAPEVDGAARPLGRAVRQCRAVAAEEGCEPRIPDDLVAFDRDAVDEPPGVERRAPRVVPVHAPYLRRPTAAAHHVHDRREGGLRGHDLDPEVPLAAERGCRARREARAAAPWRDDGQSRRNCGRKPDGRDAAAADPRAPLPGGVRPLHDVVPTHAPERRVRHEPVEHCLQVGHPDTSSSLRRSVV